MSGDLAFKSFLESLSKTKTWASKTAFKICYKFFSVYLAMKDLTKPPPKLIT